MQKKLKTNADNDTRNKGKPWEDWELREILRDAPTPENIERWSRIFKRGRGSIQLVYRWAYSTKRKMDRLVETHNQRAAFASRVWHLAREMGLLV